MSDHDHCSCNFVESDEWEPLADHPEFEIQRRFPYPIRDAETKKVIKEFKLSNGYVRLRLEEGKDFLKHRLVANQWICNDHNMPFVDHADKTHDNYHISNLSRSTHVCARCKK